MNRPQWNRQKVTEVCNQQFELAKRKQSKVIWVGVRGYFMDSMGVIDQNDRGIYDDAFFLISPSYFQSFNANTDPSRKGTNPDTGKGYAVLQCGIWDYKIGIHGLSKPRELQYEAFVQAKMVEIMRDGSNVIERGFFGINGHRGGEHGTSSLGCQTVIPSQYKEFFDNGKAQLIKYEQNIIPYVLIEQQG